MIAHFLSATALLTLLASPTYADEKHRVGRFQSRAIFIPAAACPSPLVIMLPGSGAHGPEEMMPGNITGDGKNHSIFDSFSRALSRGNVATLALGKPGVEFFTTFEEEDFYYDIKMYSHLAWQDLLDNVDDAVEFAKTLPCVNSKRIYLLGHSEGTQVAIDFANQNLDEVEGLILIGFLGENLATTLDWQLFQRLIDDFLKPDADTNQDGLITRAEADAWPEFYWSWKEGQTSLTFAEVEATLRQDSSRRQVYQSYQNFPLYQDGIFERVPLYDIAARLPQEIFVYTGELDIQTRPQEALRLEEACLKHQKTNCRVEIVPGLGHAMSQPLAPRRQKLLDVTMGPVDESFLGILQATAEQISNK